jgi:probable rRNA maturation factor
MILLDPDLGPDLDASAAPRAAWAARRAAAGKLLSVPDLRLPSSRTLARFLAEAKGAVRLHGQVTVLLTTDNSIRRLNRQFRGKNKATDVLSFPAAAMAGPDGAGPDKVAGDLAISVPRSRKQAVEQGHSLSMEIKVLILHGLLHLAGYDHETDQGEMARCERILRSRLKLRLGLIERVEIRPHGDSISGKKQERATARVDRGLHIPTLSRETRRKDGARRAGSGVGARRTKS